MKITYYYPPNCPFDVYALCDPAPGYNNGRAIAGAMMVDEASGNEEVVGISKKFDGELVEYYAKDLDGEPEGMIEINRADIAPCLRKALDHAIVSFIDKDYAPTPLGWSLAGGPTPQ